MNEREESLRKMVAHRDTLFDEDGADNSGGLIDSLARTIWEYLNIAEQDLSFEVIFETITHLGGAPSLLYDDAGYFAIGGDGTQPVMQFHHNKYKTEETTFDATWWIPPGGWQPTIREALRVYLTARE